MRRLEKCPCTRLVKVEKWSEAWNNAKPWSNLMPNSWGIKKQREIEIIWYFRDEHGADERCICAKLVEIKKRRVIKIIWYLKGAFYQTILDIENARWIKRTWWEKWVLWREWPLNSPHRFETWPFTRLLKEMSVKKTWKLQRDREKPELAYR